MTMMSKKVLIVDDEPLMRSMIAEAFEDQHFSVLQAGNGKEAIEIFEKHPIDLLILDVMMPVMDGWSTCRRIREKSNVIIIMLTARDEDDDQLLGYELGVDEYVTKPVNLRLLMAKSKRLLERVSTENEQKDEMIDKAGIHVDKKAYSVKVGDNYVDFAPKEYELLVYLMENDGLVLSREKILDVIWGYDYFGDDRVVDTHIKKIRRKLDHKSYLIQTVIRTGYKFDSKTADADQEG